MVRRSSVEFMSCAELYTEQELRRNSRHSKLAGMAEEYDVAFLDHVVLAFQANLGFFTGGTEASRRQQIVPANHFGSDESFFDVAVDGAGGSDGVGAFVNGPGADFGFAGGKE